MYHAEVWAEAAQHFRTMDEVLSMATDTPPIPPSEWAMEATETSNAWTVRNLQDTGKRLINSAPFNELRIQIDDFTGTPMACDQLRYARKFLMVSRDIAILTVPDVANAHYDPLFRLCRSLGRAADKGTINSAKVHKRIDTLADANIVINDPIDDQEFRARISRTMDSSLQVLSAGHQNQANIYHEHRKNFRRVAHIALAEAARTDRPSDRLLAARGITINRQFGNIKDKLCA